LLRVRTALAEMAKPFSQNEYVAWLKEKKLQDAHSVRLRWLAYVESRRRALSDAEGGCW
jgi:hypothetical protein